jgi:hypothetical protein
MVAAIATAQPQQTPRPHPPRSLQTQQAVQQTGQLTHPVQPTDPSGYSQRLSQTPSIEDAMRHAVNPCDRDYGRILYGWQDTAVQYTIANWVWWFGVIAVLCLLAALGYIWWYTELWQARQDCFVRAAAVLIGQRNTAYQSARFAINKHNALVERFDRLFIELNEAKRARQAAEAIETSRDLPQPLFPDDRDAEPAIETTAPVVEALGGTLKADQIFKVNDVEYVRLEDYKRRIRSFENTIKNLRATKQQQADRLAQFEGTN